MKLHSPFLISARLLPAVKMGDSYISIEIVGSTSSGRARYQYYIDTPTFEHTDTDLKSGCQGGSLESGMESLLAFLEAAAESYRYRGCVYTGDPDDNSSLFPQQVTEWAYQHSAERHRGTATTPTRATRRQSKCGQDRQSEPTA